MLRSHERLLQVAAVPADAYEEAAGADLRATNSSSFGKRWVALQRHSNNAHENPISKAQQIAVVALR